MIKESVTAQEVVDLLNEALELDHDAMRMISCFRVLCNEKLQEHSTIQVREDNSVSILGLLNGVFGVNENGGGCIAAVHSVDCPNGCKQAEDSKLTIRDSCPNCGSLLKLGVLIKFIVLDRGKQNV